jgi:protein-tyrosine phosphatase
VFDFKSKIGVLFVCSGNLCRSPTARAVFSHYARKGNVEHRLLIESAGTHVGVSGDPADTRAARAAAGRGYDMSRHKTRALRRTDFERFHFVLAADDDNFNSMLRICPQEFADKLQLLMRYGSAGTPLSIPDPYYGGPRGFERVLDMAEDAAQGLLRHIREQHRI